MRSSFQVVLAALALNAAAQDFDIAAVIAAPDPTYSSAVGVASQAVTYDTAAIIAQATSVTTQTAAVTDVASSTAPARRARRDVHARSACGPQPSGATGAPAYSPDSASAFLAQTSFGVIASAAPVPTGYNQVFSNLQASNNAYGYLGYSTLQTYDTQACANQCNKINGCMAVNIYFERDPSVIPGTGCDNPSSVTQIKCVFWGGEINSANAVNSGQWRDQFQVVIAGSNGYVNTSIATPAGYTVPTYLGNAAINAPYDADGCNSYMGYKLFTQGAFNLQLCADFCSSQSAYNLAHPPTDGSPVQTCQFWNTYMLYLNSTSHPQGQYCAIYSESWDSSYATNKGQYQGYNHVFPGMSYSSSNKTNPGAQPNAACGVAQASQVIVAQTLQPFCSSYIGALPSTSVVATTFYTTPSATSVSTIYTTETTTTVTTTTSIGNNNAKRTVAASGPPAALTQYPSAILSSACSLVATPSTTTVSSSATVTASTTVTTVSSTTIIVTPTATVQNVSPYFYLKSSDGRYVYYNPSASAFPLVENANAYISGRIDQYGRLNYGNQYYAKAAGTGVDQIVLNGSNPALQCTLANYAAGTGAFTCSVPGPGGQAETVFSVCSDNYLYIGTGAGAGCNVVTLTAYNNY